MHKREPLVTDVRDVTRRLLCSFSDFWCFWKARRRSFLPSISRLIIRQDSKPSSSRSSLRKDCVIWLIGAPRASWYLASGTWFVGGRSVLLAKELSNGHQQILQEGIKRRTIKMTRLPYFSTISWLLLVHSTAVGVQAFQSPSKSGSGGVSRSILSARTLPLRPALFASKKPLDRAHKGESESIRPWG